MKSIFFSIFILLMPFAVAAQIACYSFDDGIVRDQVSQEVGITTRCEAVPDRFGRNNGAIHVPCAQMGDIVDAKTLIKQ